MTLEELFKVLKNIDNHNFSIKQHLPQVLLNRILVIYNKLQSGNLSAIIFSPSSFNRFTLKIALQVALLELVFVHLKITYNHDDALKRVLNIYPSFHPFLKNALHKHLITLISSREKRSVEIDRNSFKHFNFKLMSHEDRTEAVERMIKGITGEKIIPDLIPTG